MAYSREIAEMGTGINHTGDTYADVAEENSKIEQKIGLSLAKNNDLTNLAKKIHEKSQIASKLEDTDHEAIKGQADSFGGARASQEKWSTLGRYVFETMHIIEKNKGTYSTSGAPNHPYFPEGAIKPEFDQPINQYTWGRLPKQIQRYLSGTDNFSGKALIKLYDDLSSDKRKEVLLNYRYENASMDMETVSFINISQSLPEEIIDAVQCLIAHPENDSFREIAKDRIRTKMNTLEGAELSERDKQQKAQLAALLDIVVDKHTSGDHTNIVSMNRDGRAKDQWIEDTVKAGKPIISGPSGHTLRYLNFWKKKRDEQKQAEGELSYSGAEHVENWPSLEAARLVMMANLLPPRHHSYDEVMTASIGIADETNTDGNSLKYKHKSSYHDLTGDCHKDAIAKAIAQKAFTESEASTIQSNTDIDGLMDKRNATIDAQVAETIEHLWASLKKVPKGHIPDVLGRITQIQNDLEPLIASSNE